MSDDMMPDANTGLRGRAGYAQGRQNHRQWAYPPEILLPLPPVQNQCLPFVTTKTGITGRKTGVALNTGSSPRITDFLCLKLPIIVTSTFFPERFFESLYS